MPWALFCLCRCYTCYGYYMSYRNYDRITTRELPAWRPEMAAADPYLRGHEEISQRRHRTYDNDTRKTKEMEAIRG